MRAKVALALKTNAYVVSQVGVPKSVVAQDAEPWKISVERDGRRHGYYTYGLIGPKGSDAIKAYWSETTDGTLEIDAIYHSKAWAQDTLVWGTPKPPF